MFRSQRFRNRVNGRRKAFGSRLAPETLEQRLVLAPRFLATPVEGVPFVDHVVSNYADLDPGPDVRDYEGGKFTYDGHVGHDILLPHFEAMDAGVDVYAAADGVVTFVHDREFDRHTDRNDCAGRGNNGILIDHGDGWETFYAHLKKESAAVSPGETVRAGQTIAQVGSSGCSSGPHLHWEILRHGDRGFEPYLDAQRFLKKPVSYTGATPTVLDFGISDYNPAENSSHFRDRPREKQVFDQSPGQRAYLWYTFAGTQANRTWNVKWYRPDGAVYFDRDWTLATAIRLFRHAPYINLPKIPDLGTWEVVLTYAGEELVRESFEVVATDRPKLSVVHGASNARLIQNPPNHRIDFGQAAEGESLSETFTIRNVGTAPLGMHRINAPSEFTVSGQLPTSLDSGQSQTFTVNTTAKETGYYSGLVQIHSDDRDWPTFNIPVQAILAPPRSGSFVDSGQQLGPVEDINRRLDVALGDINRDGYLDVLVGNHDGPNHVYLSQGNGFFNSVPDQLLGADMDNSVKRQTNGVALEDLDGDGWLDAVTVNGNSLNSTHQTNKVWLNDRHGRFIEHQSLGSGLSSAVETGDFNEDKHSDILIVNYTGSNQVWLNDGQGQFTQVVSFGDPTHQSNDVKLADLNNDGHLDALITSTSTHVLQGSRVWLNDGAANFQLRPERFDSSGSTALTLNHLNKDGIIDAVFSRNVDHNTTWFGDGTGGFPKDQMRNFASSGSSSVAVATEYLDGDSRLDIFVVNLQPDFDTAWMNDGTGQLKPTGQKLTEQKNEAVALGDLDNDGDIDAFLTESRGQNTVLFNNDRPLDIALEHAFLDEATPGATVGNLVVIDPNPLDRHVFTLSDDRFQAVQGELRLKPGISLDYEAIRSSGNASLDLTITATDQAGEGVEVSFSVEVRDISEPPDVAERHCSINENSAKGTFVCSVVASDPDLDDELTYAIVAANHDNAFQINPVTGDITVNNSEPLDFEMIRLFEPEVQATDRAGLTSEPTPVRIQVNNLIDEPPTIENQTCTIDENAEQGSFVCSVVASDPDLGDELTYHIVAGNDAGAFQIHPVTGDITVNDSEPLDFEMIRLFEPEVQATDRAGFRSEPTKISVDLNDLLELFSIDLERFYAGDAHRLELQYEISMSTSPVFDLVFFSSQNRELDQDDQLISSMQVAAASMRQLGLHELPVSDTVQDSLDTVLSDLSVPFILAAADPNSTLPGKSLGNPVPFIGAYKSAASVLAIRGSNRGDTVQLGSPKEGTVTIFGSLSDQQLSVAGVSDIRVATHAGDDLVETESSFPIAIWLDLGEGEDTATGTSQPDIIFGGDGSDSIFGLGGNDRLIGGKGNDTIKGGLHDDQILGGDGNDSIDGSSGDDVLRGGRGLDRLAGGSGNDVLAGQSDVDWYVFDGARPGSDTIRDSRAGARLDFRNAVHSISVDLGTTKTQLLNRFHSLRIVRATAVDIVLGTRHDDVIVGNSLSNTLRGFQGRDRLLGQRGNDLLLGGDGDDSLYGGRGKDVLRGERHSDLLFGGDFFRSTPTRDDRASDVLDGGRHKDTAWIPGTRRRPKDVLRRVETTLLF